MNGRMEDVCDVTLVSQPFPLYAKQRQNRLMLCLSHHNTIQHGARTTLERGCFSLLTHYNILV